MATDGLSPAQWALLAVESGWSARAGLERFRAEGGHIRDATWNRLTAEIRSNISGRAVKYSEPVNRIPVAAEIKRWETTNARGYIQQVEVLVRDKATGLVMSRPFSLASKTLVSRNTALKKALETYGGDNEGNYPEVILGAVYSGTYQMVPRGS